MTICYDNYARFSGYMTIISCVFQDIMLQVSDSSVEKICATCPDMEELVLMRCSLTGKCVSHISKVCTSKVSRFLSYMYCIYPGMY